jgi:hypothetical protein
MAFSTRSDFGDYHDNMAVLMIAKKEGERGKTDDALEILQALYEHIEKERPSDYRSMGLLSGIADTILLLQRISMTVNKPWTQSRHTPVHMREMDRFHTLQAA